jgi:hypothetical protein
MRAILTDFFMVFLSPSTQMRGQYLHQATTASFKILSNSSTILPFDALQQTMAKLQLMAKTCKKIHCMESLHPNTLRHPIHISFWLTNN